MLLTMSHQILCASCAFTHGCAVCLLLMDGGTQLLFTSMETFNDLVVTRRHVMPETGFVQQVLLFALSSVCQSYRAH